MVGGWVGGWVGRGWVERGVERDERWDGGRAMSVGDV